jgi:succinyl-CoA synthetase beta subunit
LNLYEYEGKQLFKQYGIPVPRGKLVYSPHDAEQTARELGGAVAIKSQVLSGKRGKAGGIRLVETPEDAFRAADDFLFSVINDEIVQQVLVEEQVPIAEELYLGITIDRKLGKALLIISRAGGMNVEEQFGEEDALFVKMPLDGLRPFWVYQLYEPLKSIGLEVKIMKDAAEIAFSLIKLFFSCDATTVEINPLAVTKNGSLIALDSKVVLDDSAKFRAEYWPEREEKLSPLELQAKKYNLAYVSLNDEGTIGVIAGGAGLGMATVDMVAVHGAKPSDFLDTGGGITEEQMTAAINIIAQRENVKGILINVFGGINNCEIMGRGIAKAVDEGISLPIVVKMRGHGQEEGWKMLEERNIPIIKYGTTEEAVEKLLSVLKENK